MFEDLHDDAINDGQNEEFYKFLGLIQESIDDDEEIPFTLQDAVRYAEDFNFNEYFWDDPEGIILEHFPQLNKEETR